MLKHLIANGDEAKAMTEHTPCDFKCEYNSGTNNSKQKWKSKTCQCEWENYHTRKKDYSWNSSPCICENSKNLKSVTDTSVTEFDEIVIVMDIVHTKKQIL